MGAVGGLVARMILAGDVGGTNARFALLDDGGRRVRHQEVLESRSFRTFDAALECFLRGAREKGRLAKMAEVRAASFGVAGPVVEGRVRTTNLPWVIDANQVERSLRLRNVSLLNDLVAVGLGARSAPASKLHVLHVGRPRKKPGNVAVIAAGTGLGEATFVSDGTHDVACATEGSHVDFAPRTPVEGRLLAVLAREFGHVSYERVASGSILRTAHRPNAHPKNRSSVAYVSVPVATLLRGSISSGPAAAIPGS